MVGYALQGGRCRSCGAAIPIVYPTTEALAALAFGGLAAGLGPWTIAVGLGLLGTTAGIATWRLSRRSVTGAQEAPVTDVERRR